MSSADSAVSAAAADPSSLVLDAFIAGRALHAASSLNSKLLPATDRVSSLPVGGSGGGGTSNTGGDAVTAAELYRRAVLIPSPFACLAPSLSRLVQYQHDSNATTKSAPPASGGSDSVLTSAGVLDWTVVHARFSKAISGQSDASEERVVLRLCDVLHSTAIEVHRSITLTPQRSTPESTTAGAAVPSAIDQLFERYTPHAALIRRAFESHLAGASGLAFAELSACCERVLGDVWCAVASTPVAAKTASGKLSYITDSDAAPDSSAQCEAVFGPCPKLLRDLLLAPALRTALTINSLPNISPVPASLALLPSSLTTSDEIKSAVSDTAGSVPVVVLCLQLLMASPRAFNLRNVFWHGFIPLIGGEVSPPTKSDPNAAHVTTSSTTAHFASFLYVLTASIIDLVGTKSLLPPLTPTVRSVVTPSRRRRPLKSSFPADSKFAQHLVSPAADRVPFPLSSATAATAPELNSMICSALRSSYFIVRDRLADAEDAISQRLLTTREYDRAVTILLPVMEHSLRRAFVVVNDLPAEMLTARSSILYTTLDSILERWVSKPVSPTPTSGGSDPAAPPPLSQNRLFDESVFGMNRMEALYDWLVYRNGPRIRDRLAHAECDTSKFISADMAWFGVGLLLTLSRRLPLHAPPSDSKSPVSTAAVEQKSSPVIDKIDSYFDHYQSAFSPVSQLFRSLSSLHGKLVSFRAFVDSVTASAPADDSTAVGTTTSSALRVGGGGSTVTTDSLSARTQRLCTDISDRCGRTLPLSPFVSDDAKSGGSDVMEWYLYRSCSDAYQRWSSANTGGSSSSDESTEGGTSASTSNGTGRVGVTAWFGLIIQTLTASVGAITTETAALQDSIRQRTASSRKRKVFEKLCEVINSRLWLHTFTAIALAILAVPHVDPAASTNDDKKSPAKPKPNRPAGKSTSPSVPTAAATDHKSAAAKPKASVKTQLLKQIAATTGGGGSGGGAAGGNDPQSRLFRTISNQIDKLPGMISESQWAMTVPVCETIITAIDHWQSKYLPALKPIPVAASNSSTAAVATGSVMLSATVKK